MKQTKSGNDVITLHIQFGEDDRDVVAADALGKAADVAREFKIGDRAELTCVTRTREYEGKYFTGVNLIAANKPSTDFL